jgi:UPF0755 protein
LEDQNNISEYNEDTEAAGEGSGKRSRIRFRVALAVIAAVIAVSLILVFGVNVMARPYDRTCHTYSEFKVESGDKLPDTADKLEEAGFIGSASRFVVLNKILFKEKFKPGIYLLSPSMDSVAISDTMIDGMTTSEGFTIPAGYTVEQVAAALARDGFVDEKEFLKIARTFDFSDIDFIGNDIKGEDQLEGFMFPDSYSINSNADEIMIIVTILNQFGNFFNDDCRARADELGLTVRQVVCIASMIEKETNIDKEKADISSVLHNRVNMGLIDEDDLPDVPLCSPGPESITAALYPNDNEYTYYVLDSSLDGTHRFTDDEDEYKEWQKEYKEALADRDGKRDDQAEDKETQEEAE